MIPASSSRVPEHTTEEINDRIRRHTEANIAYFASEGRGAIDQRLAELDREWDTERVLETNAASISLLGLTLGATVNRKWFILPAVVATFLLQHGIQGWCPPLIVFRRMGIRTQSEIDYERYALKAVRGDFEQMPSITGRTDRSGASRVLQVVQS